MNLYRFPLKEVFLRPQAPPFRYRDALLLLLQQAIPGRGIKKAELKQRMALQRIVERSTTEVELGENAMTFVRAVAEHFPWSAATAPIEQFLDDLERCPVVEIADETPTPGEKETVDAHH